MKVVIKITNMITGGKRVLIQENYAIFWAKIVLHVRTYLIFLFTQRYWNFF